MKNLDLIKDEAIKRHMKEIFIDRGGGWSTLDGERLLSIDGKFHQILAANLYISALKTIFELLTIINKKEN
jgi:hypothetical protein